MSEGTQEARQERHGVEYGKEVLTWLSFHPGLFRGASTWKQPGSPFPSFSICTKEEEMGPWINVMPKPNNRKKKYPILTDTWSC